MFFSFNGNIIIPEDQTDIGDSLALEYKFL